MKENEKETKKAKIKEFKKGCKEAIKQLFSKEWYKQIPNLLTASRLFSPIVVLPLLLAGNFPAAIGAEIGFALTDLFDGLIARKLNVQSEFGKNLDAITDKFFAGNLMLPLILFKPALSINLGLEVLIGYINVKAIIKKNKTGSSKLGKVKTAALSTSIILSYASLFINIPLNILITSLIITSGLQGIAVADYYIKDKKQDKKKDNKDDNNKINNTENEDTKDELSIDLYEPVNNYNNTFPKEESKAKVFVKTLKKNWY